MKCAEIRKLSRLYLDSELDAKTSLEVEQHLESCAECAGLFEAEEKFDERLGKALRKGEKTASLWKTVEARIKPASLIGRFNGLTIQRFTKLWPLAAAGSVVGLAAVVWLWAKPRTLDLAAAVRGRHTADGQPPPTPEFTGTVPDKAERHLGHPLRISPFSF